MPSWETYIRQLDDLSTAETQFLVVVQYSVHVLNPHSIYRPVKHEPAQVHIPSRCTAPDQRGQDSIGPVNRARTTQDRVEWFLGEM